jgi:hypothetical protein
MGIWVFGYDIVGGRGYRKEDGQESEASNEQRRNRTAKGIEHSSSRTKLLPQSVGGQRNRIIGSPLAAQSAACERHCSPRSQARPVLIDRIGLNGHPMWQLALALQCVASFARNPRP